MAKKSDMSFEDKMNKLQNIVAQLEKDDTELNKSLDLYQEGLKLSKELKDELSKFEEKIDQLNNDENE